MPIYKVLGIYSFADNLKDIKLNDSVVLKKEKYNIKSETAIGVYLSENKKIGYLPNENIDNVELFKNSFKVSKISLHQLNPILEISRYYDPKNSLDNIEPPYIKKIKYDYTIVEIPNKLNKEIDNLIKYLGTKKIKILKAAVLYYDNNYINLCLETNKGIETFYSVTYNYFNANIDKYEELLEYDLIDNTFYRDLLFYRLECYYESNYKNISDIPVINNFNINKSNIDVLEILIEDIDIILLTKLYINYLITNNSDYLLKYTNKFANKIYTSVDKILKKIIPNYHVLKTFYETYDLKLGKFSYDHKYNIYSYIEFYNSTSIIIISEQIDLFNIFNCYLLNKNKIIYYNPEKGLINIIDLDHYNFFISLKKLIF